jgi:hypothetical protein
MPTLLEYPKQLADGFCWYTNANRAKGISARTVGKGIDHECYHGFGHAMFYIVAKRQLRQQMNGLEVLPTTTPQINARLQVLPNSGFELSPESMCQVYNLCKGAKRLEDDYESSKYPYSKGVRVCLEGVVHSVRLFSDTRHNKKQAIQYVNEEMMRCAKVEGDTTEEEEESESADDSNNDNDDGVFGKDEDVQDNDKDDKGNDKGKKDGHDHDEDSDDDRPESEKREEKALTDRKPVDNHIHKPEVNGDGIMKHKHHAQDEEEHQDDVLDEKADAADEVKEEEETKVTSKTTTTTTATRESGSKTNTESKSSSTKTVTPKR